MARGIDTLPVELLLSVTSRLDCSSLLNAALVSRRFHDAAVGHLYRQVFYTEIKGYEEEGGPEDHIGCGMPDSLNSHLPLIPRGTRIFDIKRFYQTMDDSKELRIEVLAASFCWHAEPLTPGDLLLRRLYSILAPSIKFFHLSPPAKVGRTCVEYPVTSLQIDGDQINKIKVLTSNESDECGFEEAERERMHTVFANPTLKRLSLEDIESWEAWLLPPVADWRKTSNVTHLAIPLSGYPDEDLVEVVGWPRALRSFSFSLSYEFRWFGHSLVLPIIADAIWQQRNTLEFVELGEKVIFSLADAIHAKRGLRDYPCLSVLALQSQSFTMSRRGGEEVAMEEALNGLPPMLETLQIQLNGVWEKNTRHSELLPPWLRNMASRKATYTPHLRLVILWAQSASSEASDPDLCDEWLKTREAMNKVGMALRWANGRHSPISDARLKESDDSLEEGSAQWRIWDAYGIPRYPPTKVQFACIGGAETS